MDYRVYHRKADLDGTGYVEIGPGKYAGLHWQDGNTFIKEDAFFMAEGIIAKHFTEYDHFAPNNIPKEDGREILAEWRAVSSQLHALEIDHAISVLQLSRDHFFLRILIEDLTAHKAEISDMLQQLADVCDEIYQREIWMCILGV